MSGDPHYDMGGFTRCSNLLWDGRRSYRCARDVGKDPEGKTCNICLAARKRGEKVRAELDARYKMKWARIDAQKERRARDVRMLNYILQHHPDIYAEAENEEANR